MGSGLIELVEGCLQTDFTACLSYLRKAENLKKTVSFQLFLYVMTVGDGKNVCW